MFFGSALTNYGVLPFLESFLEMAPCPPPRPSDVGPIDPVETPFSGFVFKIQANMDPDHRDRVAFLRVCSGHFEKGAMARHVRTGKPIRLANSTLLMGKDREEMEEAYAGDVVGLFDPGIFRIGDTLCSEAPFSYAGIPSFSPECFARVDVAGVEKRKALSKGIEQLVQEGAVQLFSDDRSGGSATLILGAMGQLQFDVLKHRLASEYKVELRLAAMPFVAARWPQGDFDPEPFKYSDSVRVVYDRDDRPVLLFQSAWNLESTMQRNPDLVLSQTADDRLFEGDLDAIR
jgi:peptide chain release factor 3